MSMNTKRRELLGKSTKAAAVAGVSSCAGAVLAQAQNTATNASSTKSMRILVGFPPGGGTDVIARMLAERLRDELGQPILVENRPGAGGQLAAQALKASSPDGTTMFISHDHTITILPLVMKNPVMVASGTFGYGIEYGDVVDVERLGAICCKGTTLKARIGNPTPRVKIGRAHV